LIIGITGSTGGLGRRLSELLNARGYHLKCLVRKSSNTNFLNLKNIELVYGDITDEKSLKEFIKGIDICIHIAAQVSSAPKTVLHQINVEGTRNICEAIRLYNHDCRFIYCSSIVVCNYRKIKKYSYSDYTISKYDAEQVVNQYFDELKTTIIYPGYIYGPYDRLLIPSIIKMLKDGLPFYVNGGEKNAPVVYIDDLCELFIKCIFDKKAIGKKYVSLEKTDIGIHEIIRVIASLTGYSVPTKKYPKWFARIYMKINTLFLGKTTLSLREINILSNHAKYFNNAQEIGWKQKTTIADGLIKAINWYNQSILSQEGYYEN